MEIETLDANPSTPCPNSKPRYYAGFAEGSQNSVLFSVHHPPQNFKGLKRKSKEGSSVIGGVVNMCFSLTLSQRRGFLRAPLHEGTGELDRYSLDFIKIQKWCLIPFLGRRGGGCQ